MAPLRLAVPAAVVASCAWAGADARKLPFARAALQVAGLPALRDCEGDGDSQTCENPQAAVQAWNYALNNARYQVASSGGSLPRALKLQLEWVSGAAARHLRGRHVLGGFRRVLRHARGLFAGKFGEWLAGEEDVEGTLGRNSHPFLHTGAVAYDTLAHPFAFADLGNTSIELNGKVGKMPVVGFGTWQLGGQACEEAVRWALEAGYRHIDTAQNYENEREVGQALEKAGVPREEVFLVTKLSEDADFARGRPKRVLAEQLRKLRTSGVDLYMLHGPAGNHTRTLEAWRVLEHLFRQKKARAIGVSNFGVPELQQLLDHAAEPPVYLQNKFSVYDHGTEGKEPILPFCRQHDIAFVGYSIINPEPGVLAPLYDPHVLAVAARHGKTASQVLHRWALQLGVAVLPRSAKKARIEENAALFDFALPREDMVHLSGLAALVEDVSLGAEEKVRHEKIEL